MILRAGRWYSGKPVFHVLLPIVDEGDYSGFEEVLMALSCHDTMLASEVFMKCVKKNEQKGSTVPTFELSQESECIVVDMFSGSDSDKIRERFENVRRKTIVANSEEHSRLIQRLCLAHSIDTSLDYKLLKNLGNLPTDPRPKHMTWYDFLHPTTKKINAKTFILEVAVHHPTAREYDQWRALDGNRHDLPSVQHITDGYFGQDGVNYTLLREKFLRTVTTRRSAGRT